MISILIPAYNEAKRIGGTIEAIVKFFDSQKIDYEIVVAVDGTKDRTREVVESFAKNNKRIILSFEENRSGKGAALYRAFRSSHGSRIVFADADNASQPEELLKLANALDGCDVAWGTRNARGTESGKSQPLWRYFLGRVYGWYIQFLFLIPFYDVQSGYKAFKREVLEEVFPKMKVLWMEYDLELLARILNRKYNINHVPITWSHVEGSPSFNIVEHLSRMPFIAIKIRLITMFEK